MPVLNDAAGVYVGTTQAAGVYLGSVLVWEPGDDPGGEMSFAEYKQAVIDEMVGFAAYGEVTGGLDGDLFVVDTTASSGTGSLRDALSGSNRWIVFDRDVFPADSETVITLSSQIDMRNISNVTVDGFGARVHIKGFGITTADWSTTSASNISNNLCFINLKFSEIAEGNYDCLTIDGTDRAWLYHLEMTDGGDGNLDITHVHAGPNANGFMTIQNCYIHDSQSGKGCLLGNQTIDQGDYVSSSSTYPSGNGGDNRITIWESRFSDEHRNPIVANYWVHTVNSYVHDWVYEGFAVMGLNGHLRVENCVIDGDGAGANAEKGIFAWTYGDYADEKEYKRWSNSGNVFLNGATELNGAGARLNPSGSIYTVPYSYSAASVTGDSGAALVAQLTDSDLTNLGRAGIVVRDGYYDLVDPEAPEEPELIEGTASGSFAGFVASASGEVTGDGPEFEEDFTGSNGASWPSDWTTSNSTGAGTIDIQGNRGRMLTATTNFNVCRAILDDGIWDAADGEIYGEVETTSGNRGQVNIVLRGGGAWSGDAPTDGYLAHLNMTGDQVMLFKMVSGSGTQIGSTESFSFTNSVVYAFRFSVVGTALKFKVWDTGGAEPGWLFEETDSTVTGPGQVQLAFRNLSSGDARTLFWDNLAIEAP